MDVGESARWSSSSKYIVGCRQPQSNGLVVSNYRFFNVRHRMLSKFDNLAKFELIDSDIEAVMRQLQRFKPQRTRSRRQDQLSIDRSRLGGSAIIHLQKLN